MSVSERPGKSDYARGEEAGASKERMGVAMALEQLDRVITPLERKIRRLEREVIPTQALNDGLNAELISRSSILTDVSQALRRGVGVDAMTKVASEFSDQVEVISITTPSLDIIYDLGGALVGSGFAFEVQPNLSERHVTHPTHANRLYMTIDQDKSPKYKISIVAAKEMPKSPQHTPGF